MKYLQKIGLSVAVFLFLFSLLGLAVSFTLSKTIRDKDTVKTWLQESGFYEEIGDSLIGQLNDSNTAMPDDSIDLADPEIQSIINQSFSPELFQDISESVIDASYSWLDGKTEQVQYDVDISQSKQQLVEGLSTYAISRINSLPNCTPVQMGAMSAMTNPFTMQCKPIGYNTAVFQQQVRISVAESLSFLPDSYNSETLQPNQADAQVLPEQARQAYQLSRWLPILFFAMLVISGVGVLLLSATRQKGLYKLGAALGAIAISLALLAIFLIKAPDVINKAMTPSQAGQSVNNVITELLSVACGDMARFVWWFAGIYFAFGLIVVLVARFLLHSRQALSTPVDANLGNDKPPLL